MKGSPLPPREMVVDVGVLIVDEVDGIDEIGTTMSPDTRKVNDGVGSEDSGRRGATAQ